VYSIVVVSFIIRKSFPKAEKASKAITNLHVAQRGSDSALAKSAETSIGATFDHERVVCLRWAALFRRPGDEWSPNFISNKSNHQNKTLPFALEPAALIRLCATLVRNSPHRQFRLSASLFVLAVSHRALRFTIKTGHALWVARWEIGKLNFLFRNLFLKS